MLDTSLEEVRFSTILPRESYLSEAIYQEELRKIFNRQWLLVGHVSSVKNPGDFYVKQVGPESMIIVRDPGGTLRAYFNVCRHRGSRILSDGSAGTCAGFVCPYHKWTYGLDGTLKRAPGSRDGQYFDFGDWSLHEARCATFHGWIFLWLGEEEPASLGEALAPMANEAALRAIGSERLKRAHREVYVVAANWKSLLENNSECYHCGFGGHPFLAVACNHQAFAQDESNGQHFPLREGMATFSMDGKRVSAKPLGTPQPDAFSTGFLLGPYFCGPVLFVDHAVSLELTPLSVDRVQLICEWYVHEEAVEGVDYELEALISVFHKTNLEDGAFAEQNYKGITSQRFTPGPLHPHREYGVKMAIDLYRQMMAAD